MQSWHDPQRLRFWRLSRLRRYSTFIDGRAELYGQTYILRHDRALSLQTLPDFLRLLDEYRISATLLAPSIPAVALLGRLLEWQRVYAGRYSGRTPATRWTAVS
jgi:hypothetical protein